jgi:hypothetical protein
MRLLTKKIPLLAASALLGVALKAEWRTDARQDAGRSPSPEPPCSVTWGRGADRKAIERAMLGGSAADVVAAVNNAKEARGNRVGCPESAATYSQPNFEEPTPKTLAGTWAEVHAPGLAAYREACPRAARSWGFAALGGYYARLAGQDVGLGPLARIADVFEATQYKEQHAPPPLKHAPGVFGYLSVSGADACADKTDIAGKPLWQILDKMCADSPRRCATYDRGMFAGKRFVVADVEPPDDLDGGAAYDHGIAGVMMIEAAIGQTEPKLKEKFKASALLAGAWAIAEPPVRNHNYTAKLVWLLAELYDWTGDARYKTAMLDKLDRDLIPGLLMDIDGDGKVDGMRDQPFSGLTPVAQRPGRMWDGHNARAVYHGMNSYALTEAYVALRDRGDTALAKKYKPFAMAMLDNLAWEVNHLGAPSVGRTQAPYALLLGLYKIAVPEKAAATEWARAAAAFWNVGIGNSFGETTASAGLYLLYKSDRPYTPLFRRR